MSILPHLYLSAVRQGTRCHILQAVPASTAGIRPRQNGEEDHG